MNQRKDSVNAGKDWNADLTSGRDPAGQIAARGQFEPI